MRKQLGICMGLLICVASAFAFDHSPPKLKDMGTIEQTDNTMYATIVIGTDGISATQLADITTGNYLRVLILVEAVDQYADITNLVRNFSIRNYHSLDDLLPIKISDRRTEERRELYYKYQLDEDSRRTMLARNTGIRQSQRKPGFNLAIRTRSNCSATS